MITNAEAKKNAVPAPQAETTQQSAAHSLKEVGQILAKGRKDRRISLETVHKDTHISLRYIRALEEGDIAQFPAEVYITGSIRRYAQYLGINADDIVEKYCGSRAQAFVRAPEPRREEPRRRSVSLVRLFLGVSIGVLLLASAGLVWLRVVTPKPAAVSRPSAAAVPGGEKKETVAAPLNLNVVWKDTSWVRIVADDTLAFEGTLPAGSAREWSAHSRFVMKIGYVPGVSITLNGKPVDASTGAAQDVNEIELTKKDVK